MASDKVRGFFDKTVGCMQKYQESSVILGVQGESLKVTDLGKFHTGINRNRVLTAALSRVLSVPGKDNLLHMRSKVCFKSYDRQFKRNADWNQLCMRGLTS